MVIGPSGSEKSRFRGWKVVGWSSDARNLLYAQVLHACIIGSRTNNSKVDFESKNMIFSKILDFVEIFGFFENFDIFKKITKKKFFWKKILDGPKKKSFQFHLKRKNLSNIVGLKYSEKIFQRNRSSGTSFARAVSSGKKRSKMSPNQGFHVMLQWVWYIRFSKPHISPTAYNP